MLGAVTALMGISTRLKLARLMFVAKGRTPDLDAVVEAAFAGGCDIVGLHDPRLARRDAMAALGVIRAKAQSYQGLIASMGGPEIAAEFGADMLVLPDDIPARRAKRLMSKWAVIGRSCNSAAEVDAALGDPDIDFLVVGPGLDHIKHAALSAPADDPESKPWFAVGGITSETIGIVLRAGAMRVAVGRSLRQAADVRAEAEALKTRLRKAWQDNPRMDAVTAAAFGAPRAATFDEAAEGGISDLTM